MSIKVVYPEDSQPQIDTSYRGFYLRTWRGDKSLWFANAEGATEVDHPEIFHPWDTVTLRDGVAREPVSVIVTVGGKAAPEI